MRKNDALGTAGVATALALLIFLTLALSTARSRVRLSSLAQTSRPSDAVTYFIADGSKSTGYRQADRELALWAFQSWERNAGKGLHFESAGESAALIRLYWAEPGGGEYGETQPLLVHGRRGAAVFIRPDVESLGPDIARRAAADDLLRETIVYLTCLHELGHALGLAHTRDFRDIMYFFGYGGDIADYFYRYRKQLRSRSDIASVSGLSDGDIARIRTAYAPDAH
jgi:hypothetical protein